MTTPGPHERLGFAIGLRIGRVLRAVHYQRHPLQVIPRLGPWFMTYAHDRGMHSTGARLNVASCEANVSGGIKGHPGLIAGVRWRLPREGDWSWSRSWTATTPPAMRNAFDRLLYGQRLRARGTYQGPPSRPWNEFSP